MQVASLADKGIVSVVCGQYHSMALDDDHRYVCQIRNALMQCIFTNALLKSCFCPQERHRGRLYSCMAFQKCTYGDKKFWHGSLAQAYYIMYLHTCTAFILMPSELCPEQNIHIKFNLLPNDIALLNFQNSR